LDLQKEACDTLTKSVTQVDKIYRSEFLSGANMPEEGDQYDRKMRELEHDTSLRSDMVNKQTRYLEEQIKNQELGENSSEKPQVTGSLVDDYADVSLEPGD
jgi:vesicle coat complex subunit